MSDEGTRDLEGAFDRLADTVPDWLARALSRLRDPGSRWIRIPAGVLCIIASALWFLPVVGVEFLPIGLLLIAQDVPFLRKPVARMIHWLLNKWDALRHWWQERQGR